MSQGELVEIRQIFENIGNVIDIEFVSKSSFFLSEIIKYRIKIRKNHDIQENRNIIIKKIISDEFLATSYNAHIAFKNEFCSYIEILPNLQKFSTKNFPIPQCYYAGKNMIILENCEGYSNLKYTQINVEIVKKILREIANLHGTSLVMKFKNPELFESISTKVEEVLYRNDQKQSIILSTQENRLKIALKLFENDLKITKILKQFEGRTREIVEALLKDHSEFDVINHGDLWINNILWNGSDLKFIDFQLMRLTSVAADLNYFFYINLHPDFYKENKNVFLNYYLEELNNNIAGISRKLTMEWLQQEMKKFAIFGLIYGIWVLPMFYPNLESLDLEKGIIDEFSVENALKLISMEERERFCKLVKFYVEQNC